MIGRLLLTASKCLKAGTQDCLWLVGETPGAGTPSQSVSAVSAGWSRPWLVLAVLAAGLLSASTGHAQGWGSPCGPGGSCGSGLTCSGRLHVCLTSSPPPPPRVIGRPPFKNPTLVNLYWDTAWDIRHPGMTMNQIDNFTSALVHSAYFSDLSEYGISGVSMHSASFKASPGCGGTAPTSITLGQVQNFVKCEVGSPGVPTGPEFIYNVFVPAATTEVDLGAYASCAASSYTAYHFHGNPTGGPVFTVIFANPACLTDPVFPPFGALLGNLSHEVAEAISDPFPPLNAILLPDREIADGCPNIPFLTSFGGEAVSRYWSNHANGCTLPIAATTPNITGMSTNGAGQHMSISIQGSGFGTLPPVVTFASNQGSPVQFSTFATTPYLSFVDGALSAGNSLNPDPVRLVLSSWSDNLIQIDSLGPEVGSSVAPQAGDAYVMTVCNPASGSCAAQLRIIPSGSFVNSITPASGPVSGGTHINLSGFGFTNGSPAIAVFQHGGTTAQVPVPPPVSDSSLALTTPPFIPGNAQVSVLTAGIPSADHPAFTYCSPSITSVTPAGPAPAGTPVSIHGSCFTGANAVQFGSVGTVTEGPQMHVQDDQNITATAPGSRWVTICDGAWVDVQVHTPNRSGYTASAITSADRFAYTSSLFCAVPDPNRGRRPSSGLDLVPFCSSHPQTCSPVATNPGVPGGRGDVAPAIEDLKDYAAEKPAIAELSKQHVLELVGQGRFAPSDPLTRGELAASLNRAFLIPAPKFPVVFTDVDAGNANYQLFAKVQPYLSAEQGIGGAYVFHADAPVDRQQAAALAVTLLEGAHAIDLMRDAKEIDAVLSPFADAQLIAPDLSPYVATAVRTKLLAISGDTFAANRTVTRGEWAQILWNMQKAFTKR